MSVIDAECSSNSLDLVVVLALVLGNSYIDAIAVADRIDLPCVGVESVVLVVVDVDVLLFLLVVVVLAFAAVDVALLAVASQFRFSIAQRSIVTGSESYLSYSDTSNADLLERC